MPLEGWNRRVLRGLALPGVLAGGLVTGGCDSSASAPPDPGPATGLSRRDVINKKQQDVYGTDSRKAAKRAPGLR